MRTPIDRRQEQDHDCGPTSAAVALDLLGRNADWTQIPCSTTHGTGPDTLEAFFRAIGCKVQSGEMTTADLAHHTKHGRPVLCPIQCEGEGHWVTVYRVNFSEVFYQCPLEGPQRVTVAKFRKCWWDWDRRGGTYPGFGLAVWG